MKNVLKFGFIAGFAFFTATASAKTNNHSVVVEKVSSNATNPGKNKNIDAENILKPQFLVEKNWVKLSLDNLKDEVKISVFDLSDDVYYSAVQAPKNGKINIHFNLNPETSNAYVIRIERNGEVFEKTFFVD